MAAQYDMFETATGKEQARDRRRPAAPSGLSDEAMVKHLQASGRYRVLSKLEPRPVVRERRPGYPLCGVIIDTETTGLRSDRHEVIEIGAVAFTFDATGRIGDVVDVYGGLQQPGDVIPAEITRLTGITDEMVAGQRIDLARLEALVTPADLVIAHNAAFDRPFCEKLSPVFCHKAWACSVAEIDWAARGFEGSKLGYLIGQAGYFHTGHRAVDDCFALLEVLDGTAFSALLAASGQSRARIFAENSPFDLKDRLKERGYRWSDGTDGRPKAWWIEVDDAETEDEIGWLRREIYRYDANPLVRRLTAFDRFRR